MRKNPKLLLQMLPDNDEDLAATVAGMPTNGKQQMAGNPPTTLAQVNAIKQTEEAKKLTKLKALSNTFMNNRTSNKRDFLEAIDRFQEQQLILQEQQSPINCSDATTANQPTA